MFPNQYPLPLAAAAALSLFATLNAEALTPPPKPTPPPVFKGNGVTSSYQKPLRVSLDITEAESRYPGQGSLGFFRVVVGALEKPDYYPIPEKDDVGVDLNIYKLGGDGEDTLVKTVNLDRLAWVGPANGSKNPMARLSPPFEPVGSMFGADLGDTSKFPQPLEPGDYRAEAVVRSLVFTGPYPVPVAGTIGQPKAAGATAANKSHSTTGSWNWIEVGGAAVEFAVSDINLWPVVAVEGSLTVKVSAIPRRGASRAQIDQLNRQAVDIFHKTQDQIWKYTKVHTELAPVGSPHREPWHVYYNDVVTGKYGYFVVSSGESYAHAATAIQTEIKDLCRRLSVRVVLPGGTITTSVSNGLQFQR